MVLRKKSWIALLLAFSIGSFLQSCAGSEEESEDDLEISEEFENGEEGGEFDEEGEYEEGEYANEDGEYEEGEYENGEYEEGNEFDEYANEDAGFENSEDGGFGEGEENGFDESLEYANNEGDDLENLVNGDIDSFENPLPQQNAGAENLLDASIDQGTLPSEQGNVQMTDDGYENLAAVSGNVAPQGGGAPMEAMASAGRILPEDGSKMAYIVQPGESLSGIANNIYGNASMAAEIASLSSMNDRNFVRSGDVVYYQLNDQTRAFAQAYENRQRQEIVVQPGDSLSLIAQRIYGSTEAWPTIWRHNADVLNPDQIEVGQTIYYVSPDSFANIINKAQTIRLADIVNSTLNTNIDTTTSVDADTQVEDGTTSMSSAFQVTMDILNHLSS